MVFWFLWVFFHIYFTVNLKITTLGSRSSSLWHKQYNTSLLIHRDSWILPSAVIAELLNNSVSLDMLFSRHTGKENTACTPHKRKANFPRIIFKPLTIVVPGVISILLLFFFQSTCCNRPFQSIILLHDIISLSAITQRPV